MELDFTICPFGTETTKTAGYVYKIVYRDIA